VSQGVSSQHMAQCSASNMQRLVYSAQRPGYLHENILQGPCQVHHGQTKSTESGKINNHEIQESL
jgi:hypothetical protein